MSRDELVDRIRQPARARLDGLRYRLGGDFRVDVRPTEHQPRFFFPAAGVPGLCHLLKQRLPNVAAEILRQAEKICAHHFDLLGYEDLDYGAPLDWHADLVHGKRAPRKPFYQLHYLDFTEVGDVKVTWELNRHQHLVTLAKAYRLTGDEKYAVELFAQWTHWHGQNPYPIGINWASSLEVAFRSLSWLWMYFLLGDCPAAPRDFREQWTQALGISGRHIETYLSTYFSPNTHLLGEAVALFFVGTLCPQLASAPRWKERGWKSILQEAERQVQADGLHFEQSVYYHIYALDFFFHARILASLNGVAIPREFDQTMQKMLYALCLLSRAGAPPRLGDDDGGRLFDPRRNRSEHMLDPLTTGSVLFGSRDFKSVAGDICEETLWLLGEKGISEYDRLTSAKPAATSAALAAGGLYLMADADGCQQLVIDAGPQGAATAGHGHADALSFCIHCDGNPVLIDPGTCEYVGDQRQRFRGTSAHNTLQVDGMDQADPKGPFAWSNQPRVQAERWVTGDCFDLFVGSHAGYARLSPPVIHRRWVFSRKGKFWLVRDVAEGRGQHRLDLFWHVAPDLGADKSAAFISQDQTHGLAIVSVPGHGWTEEVVQGWWSPVYGKKEPAPVLHFGTVAALPAEFVTLLFPGSDRMAESGDLAAIRGSATVRVQGYRYHTPEEEHCVYFSSGQKWTLGAWASDARFLYWGVDANGTRHLVFCGGTGVAYRGERLLSAKQSLGHCEVVANDAGTVILMPDENLIAIHRPLTSIPAGPEPAAVANSLPGSGSTSI